ncbi:MAG: hypothetical protein WAK93_18670, partial [Solirubrobacteraceae bacterium]
LTGVEGARAGASPRRGPRWRRAVVLPGATALAVVVAIAVIVIGGGTAAPTVHQTARLALASATLPAPPVNSAHPRQLAANGAGIPFPNWASAGWATTGARTDTLNGRPVTTVFYESQRGTRVGYAIVAGPPLRTVRGTSVERYGVRFTYARQGRVGLITWRENRHTCVIAGRAVDYPTLLALAAGDAASPAGSLAAASEASARVAYA